MLGPGRVEAHDYNTQGDRSALSYPASTGIGTLSEDPNGLGQPTQVGAYASGMTYHPDGSLDQATLGTNIQMTRRINTRQLPSQLRYLASGAALVALSFAFDANANVQGVTDTRPGGLDTQSYVYDQLDRLTQVTAPGRFGTALYDYDAFDNLTRSRIKGRDWRYDYQNGRLSQVVENGSGSPVFGFNYDSRGNATQAGPLAISFDRAEVVTGIQGGQGGNESYVSDAHGRATVAQPGRALLGQSRAPSQRMAGLDAVPWTAACANAAHDESRYPVYTRDGLLRTESSADNRRQDHHIYRGSQLIATVRSRLPAADNLFTTGFEVNLPNPQTRYVLTDHLGSNVATTDAAGVIVERSFFAPYGERLDDGVEIGPGYAGHYSDSTTLNYMKARYQSGLLGRFLSPDPVGVDPITGGNFNRYWYGNNNPVTMVDPDGRLVCNFRENCKVGPHDLSKSEGSGTADQSAMNELTGGGNDVIRNRFMRPGAELTDVAQNATMAGIEAAGEVAKL